ncbi:HSP70-domain-containing protein [Ceratobasidium sp. AG-I]|nr:HSP70-domain-containing protein [Ceratobasidium sp. AG-I]
MSKHESDVQRQATRDASTIAGLAVRRIGDEPATATVAYGLDEKGGETQIIVYDHGYLVQETVDDGCIEWQRRATTRQNGVGHDTTSGDTHLAGEDFDNRVIEHFAREYKKKAGTNVSKNQRAMSKLKKEIKMAKSTLSSQMSIKLEIESFENGNDFSDTLTCAKFKELNVDFFRKTMKPVEQVLKDSGVKKEDVSDLVLVQQLIKEYFGKEPSKGINPDKAVAYGAAIQDGILSGEEGVEVVVLSNVCPLTMGIKTTGSVFTKLIPHNTIVPTTKTQIFSTAADNQPTVLIELRSQHFEGECSLTKDNNLLGKFELSDIPPARRGVPQIEVAFEIDANGILKVGASDKGTGKTESITITNEKGRLSQEEIELMVRKAEEFTFEDAAQCKRIEALNGLQNFIWGLKSQLGDQEGLGGKISDNDKKTILATVKENGQTATSEDLEEKLQEVQAVVNPITGKLYGSSLGREGGSRLHDKL